jgi:hypothetical protein
MVNRKTYIRAMKTTLDETLHEGRTKSIKIDTVMVEIRKHEYVNRTAAIELNQIDAGDELLPPQWYEVE